MIKVPTQPLSTGKSAVSILEELPCEVIRLPLNAVVYLGSYGHNDNNAVGVYLVREKDFKVVTEAIPQFDPASETKIDSEFVILPNSNILSAYGINILPVPGYPKAIHQVVTAAYGEWVAYCHLASLQDKPVKPSDRMSVPRGQPDPVFVMPVKDSTYTAVSTIVDKIVVSGVLHNPAIFQVPSMEKRNTIDTSTLLNMIIGFEMLTDNLPT